MPTKTKSPAYSAPNWLLLVAPVALVPLGIVMTMSGGSKIWLWPVLLLMLIDDIAISTGQIKYLKQAKQSRRLLCQAIFIIAALLVPLIAMLAGEFIGASAYNTPPDSSGNIVGLVMGVVIAIVGAYGCAIANEIHIRAKARSSVISVIGKASYVIGFILIAAIAWISYGIAYSLQDPSTE